MPQPFIQRAFAGGELAPGLGARADLAKYAAALRTCRNFIVRRSGGASNRTGTMTVAETKTSGAAQTFLQPFLFPAANSSFVIECGDNYFRFFKNGAPVLVAGVVAWSAVTVYVAGDLASSGGINYYAIVAHTNQAPPNATYWYPLTGAIYEIPTPYPSGAFKPPAPADFKQTGLLITITHGNYPPAELVYAGDTRWVLTPIVVGPSIIAPAGAVGVAGAVGTVQYQYVVTASKAATYEESDPSNVITIPLAAVPTAAAPNALAWGAVAAAVEYNVYGDGGRGSGTFGFLGVSTGLLTFLDPSIVPDFTKTPPIPRPLFNAPNLYPVVTVVYQQRRFMGGTANNREQIYASQTGFYKHFGIRSPLQDDDAVTFTIAADVIQPVIHMLGLAAGLIVLTDAGEWIITGPMGAFGQAGAITPTAINAKQHGYVGAAFVDPVVIGENVLFVQARGTMLRELRFDAQVLGLSGRDLTIFAGHLFAGFTLVDLAYADVPDSVVWAVRSDGVLLGLTYIREEDVWGWHRHDTDGSFEQVCRIPEGAEDAVYVIVKRTIGGVVKRFVERFASRQYATPADAVFMDATKTYRGAATAFLTGLTHLAGKTVSVLADGVVPKGAFVVSGTGTLALPTPASTISVGLPITAELETLDLDIAGSAIRAAKKRVGAFSLLLENSTLGFLMGPDAAHLLAITADAWDADGIAGHVTGQREMNLTSYFNTGGRTLIRHTAPLPLTVLGVLPDIDIGG